MELNRKSGVLLHVSSLPSKWGIGDFGSEAYRFVDLLVENGFCYWQLLPLGPSGAGNSPYQAYSSFGGDLLYISIDNLLEWKLLSSDDVANIPRFLKQKVEFDKVSKWKKKQLEKAWCNFKANADESFNVEFKCFLVEHEWWLNDYALYQSCKKHFNNESWIDWPDDLRNRLPNELEKYRDELADNVEYEKFVQFVFFRQWFRLKNYANSKGVKIFGDMPIYVSLDSADVWSNQNIFLLDEKGIPTLVGGVPPDYFCEDGQLWGNPLFNWDELAEDDFKWWVARLYFHFHLFDLVRIDHFRGLESFWAVPFNAETAKEGEWLPAKGFELLKIMKWQLDKLPIIAEDLGIITPEVEKLRLQFELPGMKVLQFAFESDGKNEHLPHNYSGKCVVYTGTHDNDTTLGWWRNSSKDMKKNVLVYLPSGRKSMPQRIVEMAWASSAELAIVPMQDILELDSNARMNIPGSATGNWQWRFTKKQLRNSCFDFMKNLNLIYNRFNG